MLGDTSEGMKCAESPVEAVREVAEEKIGGQPSKASVEALRSSQMEHVHSVAGETREEKAQRLQWIMQQMIKQAVRENNDELVQRVKESVIKELDYQFRMHEEREEERARIEAERSENYYRKMDELLRKKSSRRSMGSLIKKKNLEKKVSQK